MATQSTTTTPTPKKETTPEAAAQVVEQRLKPTLIRRRAQAPAPSAPVEAATTPSPTGGPPAESQKVSDLSRTPFETTAQGAVAAAGAAQPAAGAGAAKRPGAPVPGALHRPPGPARVGEAEALRKPARRKKSKEEWVQDDIRRAGGLKHFAYIADVIPGEEVVGEEVVGTSTEAGESGAAAAVPEATEAPSPEALPREAPPPEVVERVERVFQPTARRRKRPLRREFKKPQVTQMRATKRVIRMEEAITLAELSQAMGVKGNALIQKLMQLGTLATLNRIVDADTAALLAQEYGFEIERVGLREEEHLRGETPGAPESAPLVHRPPIVTVMGHVDHGKTSVLDAVRSSNVAEGEAGGITQHIGASTVTTPKGTITFLDTPGHAAFTALRARGAKVTDLVVLVVAADDGVMPQTEEAIDHAKAAGVPIIVAVNKMDKAEADPERVKRELAEHGLVPEEWGGDLICVPTSARTKAGIDHLLEMILLQAEVLELKADPSGLVRGTVVEAKLDRGRGPVATLIVQNGTLRVGAAIVCGAAAGRVRALLDPAGRSVQEVGPGHAAEIIGLSSVPNAGEQISEATDEKAAKLIAESRLRKQRETQLARSARVSLEDLHRQLAAGEITSLNVIIKADVQGSGEAVATAVGQIGTAVAKVNVIHSGVGGITESDVLLAQASQAVIIGFNVVPSSGAVALATQEHVEIKRYAIIYELVDEVKKALQGLLAPTLKEKVLGRAEVRQIFSISKVGTVAGSAVLLGKVARTAMARLIRDSVVVHQGKLSSLRRFKEDAREVLEGFECGIGFENFHDIKPGDIIESYIIEEIAGIL